MTIQPAIRAPADVYDELFVPALFHQWGPIVADAAEIGSKQDVLDVGCGTGVLALAAVQRGGIVTGLDANGEMLAVARRKSGQVAWHEGKAEALPFADESFDAVVSQFAMMFFTDKPKALAEMMRVMRPGGRLAVAVCDGLERSPGYAALADLLQRLFGARVADAFRAPFAPGDANLLLDMCAAAGIAGAQVRRHSGTVRFDSIGALVSTERACVWTLGGLLEDDQFARLLAEAETALEAFVTAENRVAFDMPALIVTAKKP